MGSKFLLMLNFHKDGKVIYNHTYKRYCTTKHDGKSLQVLYNHTGNVMVKTTTQEFSICGSTYLLGEENCYNFQTCLLLAAFILHDLS